MRPIDADALEQKIRKTMYGHKAEMEIFLTLVDMQPTIEAVPVVHGSWEYVGECGMSSMYQCICCGYRKRHTDLSPYCPNCGVDMRK